jgi:hypothetical protein
MGGAGLIGPAISAGSKAAGGGGGGKGGGGGGFDAGPGGVSPEQAALAQYTYGQNLLKAATEFANTNTGQSTMATQASSGARFGKALDLARMSNLNQRAGAQVAAQNFQQQQSLQNLSNQQAGQAGQAAGQAAGFGTDTGGFGAGA